MQPQLEEVTGPIDSQLADGDVGPEGLAIYGWQSWRGSRRDVAERCDHIYRSHDTTEPKHWNLPHDIV